MSDDSTSNDPAPLILDPPEPGTEWTPAVISARAARGAVALGVRQLAIQGTNIVGAVLLARILDPSDFGFYGVAFFVMSFLRSVGDVGLAAGLIRQQDEPTGHELRAIFTVQLLLALALTSVVLVAAPLVASAYGPPLTGSLFQVLGISLLVTSIQTIPSAKLERRLLFSRLAAIEATQAITFNAFAVGLALAGYGAMGVAAAMLGRSVIGAVLANLASPWPFGVAWDTKTIRPLLSFGLPYQGIAFVSLLKDALTPVFIGLTLGATQVGYVYWAITVAAYPVQVLLILQRLYLPVFSRMRRFPEDLARLVELGVFTSNSAVAPLAVFTLVLIDPVTRVIFGEKWLPALPLFYLFWMANLLTATSTPIFGLLNALGDSKVTFTMAVIWMAGTWLLGAPLIVAFGAIGFAAADAVVQVTNLALFRLAKRRINLRLLRSAGPPWVFAAAVGGAVLLLSSTFGTDSLIQLGLLFSAGAVGYSVLMLLFQTSEVRALVSLARGRT